MVGHRYRRDETGFSLVELIAVMSILLVVGGVVTTALVGALRASQVAENRVTSLNDLQRGLERVGRELRAASPLLPDEDDYANSLSVQVIRGGERIVYSYYLTEPDDDGLSEMREDVERFTLDGQEISSQEGLFITEITNIETETPLFTYFVVDDLGAIVELDCEAEGLDAEACRDRHGTAKQVRLTLEKNLPGQDPLQVETIVNIRNTRFEN